MIDPDLLGVLLTWKPILAYIYLINIVCTTHQRTTKNYMGASCKFVFYLGINNTIGHYLFNVLFALPRSLTY